MNDIIAGFLKIQWDAFPAKAELFNQLAHHQHPKVLFYYLFRQPRHP